MLKKKTEAQLHSLTDEVVERVLNTLNLNIKKIILYGSYARGTADDESDVDIMIICDNTEEDVRKYRRETSHIGSEVGLKNDVYISLKLQDSETFEKWKEVMPFFRNVSDEGVILYG